MAGSLLTTSKRVLENAYNQAFFGMIGEVGTNYDTKGTDYIESGYNVNSIIYTIISQQARKTSDVPYFIKKVENKGSAKQFKQKIKTSNDSPQAKLLIKSLETKAFSEGDVLDMPLERPNIFQSWSEFFALYKTFLKTNGNVYIYKLIPEFGKNAGAPQAYYLLPSHLIDIVLKPDANMLMDESPIKEYMLIEGNRYKSFPVETIEHIKYPNPNFDLSGSHLYGQAPLRAGAKNIDSSNEAANQNIKTMKNSGVYGFIHGKSNPITPDQAKEMKDRLMEMDDNPDRLSRIAGVSAEMGFTRLSLTTDELQPFEYLKYDKEQLAGVLNWAQIDKDASDFGNTMKELKKQRIIDDIMPDLNMLEAVFNENLLPLYKGYENTMLYFDASTLPEMQLDMQVLVKWLSQALSDRTITRNEYRDAMNYPQVEGKGFDDFEDEFDEPNPLEIEVDDAETVQ